MIGLAAYDGEGAVELLHEEETHHLMRKGHLGERDLLLRSIVDAGREAVRAADEEDEALGHCLQALLHPLAELTAGELAATLVEEDEVVAGLQSVEDLIGLALLLLLFAERLGVAQVGQLLERGGQVVAEPLHVFGDERGKDGAGGAAGEEDVELQWRGKG